MSAGGINAFAPMGPAPTGGATMAAGPTPGVDAGSVPASGGLVEDGLPRTAAIAAGVASQGAGNVALANSAADIAAAQQVVDPRVTAAAPAGGLPGTTGPAAWNEAWAKRFRDVGAPAEVIQQLTFTGAMGADEAQLEQMLAQIRSEIDSQLAKFAAEHPEEFKELRAVKTIDRSTLAQIAAAVNSGQVPDDQLEQLVEQAGMTPGKMAWNMFLKPMLAYSLIPGYGLWRMVAAPFFDGKDFITGEEIKLDPMNVLMAAGGAMTMFNTVRGAMQVAQGHRLIAAGGDAARIAAAEGAGNLSGLQKAWSYMPGTHSNKVVAGISRLNGDLTQGISKLGGIERELAENVLEKWRSGQISVLGDGPIKLTKMGFQPNVRGITPMIGQRSKEMAATTLVNHKATLMLDGRMTGRTIAAQFAAAGVDFADDALKAKLLQSAGITGSVGTLPDSVSKLMRQQILGTASQQLLDAGFITRPGGLANLWGAIRPGPLQDALKAANQVSTGTIGQATGWAALPTLARWGILGTAAAGAGYMFMIKPQQDAAKKAAAEAASQQQAAAAGQQPVAGAPAGQGQMTPELQSALQQFSTLPPHQQAQLIQEQYAMLQQFAAQPNLTAEQQAQVNSAAAELQLFMQVAQGTQGAAAPQSAAGAQAPLATAVAPAGQPGTAADPSGAGAFTSRGLGLSG